MGTAVITGVAATLSFFGSIVSAQRSLNREEFAVVKNDFARQTIELKGDLASAMRRARDAVEEARQPRLTERLQQLLLESAKLTRTLDSARREATTRVKVDSLVKKLETLEADALRVSDQREGDLALLRSQLEERLRATVKAARSATQGQGLEAQSEFERIAARAAALKDSIRKTTSASDLVLLQGAVREVEAQSQRLSSTSELESRPPSDLTRLVAASGLLTSIASAVILTFVLLRMRQRLKNLSSGQRSAAAPHESIDQTKSNRGYIVLL